RGPPSRTRPSAPPRPPASADAPRSRCRRAPDRLAGRGPARSCHVLRSLVPPRTPATPDAQQLDDLAYRELSVDEDVIVDDARHDVVMRLEQEVLLAIAPVAICVREVVIAIHLDRQLVRMRQQIDLDRASTERERQWLVQAKSTGRRCRRLERIEQR